MKKRIKDLSAKYFSRVIELRRKIHAHPELSWNEIHTSKLVADELKILGIKVQTGVAKTGVVGLLEGKNPKKRCIALRADMDALPIKEQNEVAYCSQNQGVMHACGHDVHTANLLGVAMILSELKNDLEGTIKFIFQPSEEKIPSGAEAMIQAGVLENPIPEKIFGLHVSPEIQAGKFGFCSGKFMASSDEVYLTVIGKGGHAAKIEELKNPLLIASEILLELRMLTNPQIPVVLSFGKIEGKGATNIVPDTVEIAGTLRCFDEDIRTNIQAQIRAVCEAVSEKYLTECDVNIQKGYPVLINDEEITTTAKRQAEDFLGASSAIRIPSRLGSEDFAYYTQKIPSCFYRFGVGNQKKGIESGLHTSTFNIDEDALEASIGLMSWLAINA
ncbi:MAG: amidohydrolase [Bacteroidetes bacterium]|nr:amidohydrolase [Bacteroidota bacterium]